MSQEIQISSGIDVCYSYVFAVIFSSQIFEAVNSESFVDGTMELCLWQVWIGTD